ncbi:hypothetical protein BH10PSE11_BH10PSE11_30850 [soil metagenome]
MVTDVDTWAEAVVDTITVGAVGVVITMAGHAVVIVVGAKLKTRHLDERPPQLAAFLFQYARGDYRVDPVRPFFDVSHSPPMPPSWLRPSRRRQFTLNNYEDAILR